MRLTSVTTLDTSVWVPYLRDRRYAIATLASASSTAALATE
jgi:hypothetical protein